MPALPAEGTRDRSYHHRTQNPFPVVQTNLSATSTEDTSGGAPPRRAEVSAAANVATARNMSVTLTTSFFALWSRHAECHVLLRHTSARGGGDRALAVGKRGSRIRIDSLSVESETAIFESINLSLARRGQLGVSQEEARLALRRCTSIPRA